MEPAIAAQWHLVATDGSQAQYVDVDSIEATGSRVRLTTYWTDRSSPMTITTAVTEYDCDREKYRDVQINDIAQVGTWQEPGSDMLNQAVMEFACQSLVAH